MKGIKFLFLFLFLISCSEKETSDEEYLKFTENLINKIKSNKNQKYDSFINVIDVSKRIDYISDSLKFNNKVDRKIFNSKYRYERKCSEYFQNLSKNLKGKIKITNSFKSKNRIHFIICSELTNLVEVTELLLIDKDGQIKIDNFLSYSTGLDMKENYISYAIFKTNDPSFNFSNRKLEKSLNLSKQGYNKEAYELYKTIDSKHATTSNFLIVKYQIFRNLFDDLNSDEIAENYEELIRYNYENKGFRYSKGWEYYKIFGQDSIANKYQDSINILIKDEYFIKKIESFKKK